MEKKESPELVVRQTAAMNSWTSHDDKGKVHQHAHNDLEYAEKIEHGGDPKGDPRPDPRPDPPGNSSKDPSNEKWDRENYNYDIEHGDRSGAEWALERERYDERNAPSIGGHKGGEKRMAMKGRCGPGEEYVEPYRKADGTEVEGYCRKAHDRETPHDKRVERANGEKARGSTWKDRRK